MQPDNPLTDENGDQPLATPPPQAADPMIVNKAPSSVADQNSDFQEADKKPDEISKGKPKQQAGAQPPKEKTVTLAIIATVVIVLGLAALAVYAYSVKH